MTDQDVIELYRCLLGRTPENADTIAAFRQYYPDFAAGRRAILTSDEFREYAARVTGGAVEPGEVVEPFDGAAPLALGLLMHASGSRTPAAGDEAVRAGFAAMLARLGDIRLALVVGDDRPGLPLDDMVPLNGSAAVLHIPATERPLAATALADATVLFTLPWRPAKVAAWLAQQQRQVDAMFLLGPPAEPGVLPALLAMLASPALVAIGGAASPGGSALSAAMPRFESPEPPVQWRGFALHQVGAWLLPVQYTPRSAALPDRKAYPTLAIAAIVRNAAACVVNMLRSALPVASFFAVLDTGSDDGTPALVQGFLKTVAVPSVCTTIAREHFGLHFGAMRNAALDMVPDWIDWVLMLDADEELVPEDAEALLKLIATGTHDAYALPRYNFAGTDKSGLAALYPDRQVRLLRHGSGPRPRYSGAVHEKIHDCPFGMPPLDTSAIGGEPGGPHIHHLVRRFRNAEAEARTQQLYRDIAARYGG